MLTIISGSNGRRAVALPASSWRRHTNPGAPSASALETAQERLLLGPGVDVQRLRRVVTVCDLAEDPAYRPLWDEVADAGVRGVLSAPVWIGHEVVGNLNAITEGVHDWSDAERRAGAAYASLVAQLLVSATRAARRADTEGRS